MSIPSKSKLTVYAIEASGSYGGGLAIVAGANEEASKRLASEIKDQWNVDYLKPDVIKVLPVEYDGKPCVLVHYEMGE